MRMRMACAIGGFAALMCLAACAPLQQSAQAPFAAPGGASPFTAAALLSLLPVDAILLGEQHDAPDHPDIHRLAVTTLAGRGLLAALVLEMAEQGTSTLGLPREAPESEVRQRLAWQESAWPWANYGPAIMAAVRAGVEVAGANLARAQLAQAMRDPGLDGRLGAEALARQRRDIEQGHCGLLAQSQIAPMTRVQIARDQSMAREVQSRAVATKTVLLLAGAAHVDRLLGVPAHWSRAFRSASVWLRPQGDDMPERGAGFDLVWSSAAMPARDYCAELRQRMQPLPRSP